MKSVQKDANNRVSVSWLNGMTSYHPRELVRSAEQAYERQIHSAAKQVFDRREESPVLLLSGPSASSKTTTAGKIAAQLERLGGHTAVISLDDFFKNRADLPLLPNGETDFESIHTLDFDTLRTCLNTLLRTGEAAFPTFDFTAGKRTDNVRRVRAGHGTVLIVEGIHALNPQITKDCARDGFQRLYISPNSDYEEDGTLVLTAREIRLIRRLVRDHYYRGSSVENTMRMWAGVVRSEIVNIIPYRSEADIIVDSMILYEPAVWTHYLGSVLKTEDVSLRFAAKIEKLRRSLSRFVSLPVEYIPDKTVLHEFLG